MKKKINFIVFITSFLVVLLLSITVYTETGLSSTPSPSSASSPIQSKYSESSSIQLKDLIAPILTALGIAVTYQNGFNPRATLKLDLELREKLLLGEHPVSNKVGTTPHTQSIAPFPHNPKLDPVARL